MTDLKEQARRLIELDGERTKGTWRSVFERVHCDCAGGGLVEVARCGDLNDHELAEFNADRWRSDARFVAHTANHAPAIAQAYLDQCEENERLREFLKECARQKLPEEMDAETLSFAAFDDGYSEIVRRARKALGDTDV